MEEVVGTRHHNYRQVEWLGPGEDVGQGYGFVVRAVDDDGVVGDGFGVLLPAAFDKAGGGADQNQALSRVTGLAQLPGHLGLAVGAE